MSDIFREVDDALQKEKVERFWKEYGPALMVAAVLLVLSTAATTAYRAWDKSRNETETAKLLNALQTEDPLPALQEAAQDTRSGQAAIAKLISASINAQNGNMQDAANIYKAVYEDSATPAPFNDLARILFTRSALSLDNQPAAPDLLAILKPVIDNAKSPYRWQARIDAAMISGGLQKDYETALAYLAPIGTQDHTQQALKDRADKLTQLYTQKKNETAGLQTKTSQPDSTQ